MGVSWVGEDSLGSLSGVSLSRLGEDTSMDIACGSFRCMAATLWCRGFNWMGLDTLVDISLWSFNWECEDVFVCWLRFELETC